MTHERKLSQWTAIVLGFSALVLGGWLSAEPPAPPKASSYAPAADLINQIEFYVGRITEALSVKTDYEGANESRTLKDANGLAAIGLVLSLHDEDHKLKSSAPALLKAAEKLAEVSANFDKAVIAFAEVKQAAGGKAVSSSAAVKWEKVASLEQLMKQVPVVNTALKRSVTDARRFKRDAVQSAGQAATLAAIAQAAMFNAPDVNKGDVAKWYQLCADMRDGAAAVNAAAHAGDQVQATAAMQRMSVSCDKCHEVFR